MSERGRRGRSGEQRGFVENRGDLHQRMTATTAALKRNRAARNRHQAQRARTDMRSWQVQRRARTKHLIELGGLVVKSGVVELTGDDRATIYGALIWIAEKLKGDDAERARTLWAGKGKEAFAAEDNQPAHTNAPHDGA